MKEQPRQFLARLLADWKHVSEIFRKNQDLYVQRANKHIKAHRFHVGDLVLVSAAKHTRNQLRPKHPLAPKASGHFIIEAAIGPRTFSLNLPPRISRRFHNAFHESDLIPYILRLATEPEAPVDPEAATADPPPGPPHPGGPWRPLSPDDRGAGDVPDDEDDGY